MSIGKPDFTFANRIFDQAGQAGSRQEDYSNSQQGALDEAAQLRANAQSLRDSTGDASADSNSNKDISKIDTQKSQAESAARQSSFVAKLAERATGNAERFGNKAKDSSDEQASLISQGKGIRQNAITEAQNQSKLNETNPQQGVTQTGKPEGSQSEGNALVNNSSANNNVSTPEPSAPKEPESAEISSSQSQFINAEPSTNEAPQASERRVQARS